jgi:hypothetical protein
VRTRIYWTMVPIDTSLGDLCEVFAGSSLESGRPSRFSPTAWLTERPIPHAVAGGHVEGVK